VRQIGAGFDQAPVIGRGTLAVTGLKPCLEVSELSVLGHGSGIGSGQSSGHSRHGVIHLGQIGRLEFIRRAMLTGLFAQCSDLFFNQPIATLVQTTGALVGSTQNFAGIFAGCFNDLFGLFIAVLHGLACFGLCGEYSINGHGGCVAVRVLIVLHG